MGVAASRVPLLKFLKIASGESRLKEFSAFRPKIGIITIVLFCFVKHTFRSRINDPPLIFFEIFFSPPALIRPPVYQTFNFSRRSLQKVGAFLSYSNNEFAFACSGVNRGLVFVLVVAQLVQISDPHPLIPSPPLNSS